MAKTLVRIDSLRAHQCYDEALFLLDSLQRSDLPSEKNAQKILDLHRGINNELAIKEYHMTDSLIEAQIIQVASAKDGFVLDKNSLYDKSVRYILPKFQNPVSSGFGIRMNTDTLGNLEIISDYVGSQKIHHAAITFQCPDSSATSQIIPYDGALNYRYSTGAINHETVTYIGDKTQNGLTNIILTASKKKQSIKVTYLNENRKIVGKYVISPTEGSQFAKTIHLSQAYTTLLQLRKKHIRLQRKIDRLRRQ